MHILYLISKGNTATLSLEQGLRNNEYLYYLFEIMSVYINYSELKETLINDSRYNKKNYSYYFFQRIYLFFILILNYF